MKRIFLTIFSVALSLTFVAPVAFAQGDEPDVRYRKKTEIDFEDVSIDGELKKPHGAYLLDKRQSSFNPLIPPNQPSGPVLRLTACAIKDKN